MSPSFQTPNASVFTPQSTKKGTGNEDTFGLRIFGRAQTKKKQSMGLQAMKTAEVKAKAEIEEAKRKKEEEEKKKAEEEEAEYDS